MELVTMEADIHQSQVELLWAKVSFCEFIIQGELVILHLAQTNISLIKDFLGFLNSIIYFLVWQHRLTIVKENRHSIT